MGANHTISLNLFCVLLDVSDSVADGTNLLSLIIGNRNTKLLLEFHNQLYCIQRVSTKVIGETCFWFNLCFVYTEFVYDNGLYFAFNF